MSGFTEAQDQAIHEVGQSILVSAAAGSGKTTVLAERCAHLVIDARPRTTIDRLLVMTFAEEAAAEMKSRIEQRLAAKYLEAVQEKSPDAEHLKWQAMLAPGAHISTIHAFCARLIRQNFHLAALDPAFRVLDGAEAALLREEVSEQLFEEAMEGENGEAVKALVDLYGDGRDEVLRRRMIQTYETLRGIREAKLWRGRALEELEAAARKSRLVESEIGRGYLELVSREVASVRAEAMLIAIQAKGYDSPGSYVTQPQEMVTLLDEVADRLGKGDFDGADGVLDHTFARMSAKHGVPKDVAEELKKRLAKLRERMTDREKGSLRSLLGRSEAQLLADLGRTTPHARTFMELVREFEQRYHREKLQLNTLDFSDLEHVALALLGRDQDGVMVPSDLARRLHQRYDYVLVDEYQDINPVQEAILHLVSRECVLEEGKTGNLFCVGDVKQSIYRFRLAAPDIFLKRRERYVALEGGVSIDLRENFRSRGVLLQAVNAVFRRLMKKESAEIEYDQTHEFVPGLNYAAGEGTFAGVPIELHVLEKDLIRAGEAKAGDGGEGAEGQGPSGAKDAEEDSDEDLEAAEMEARHVAHLVKEMLRPADGASRQVWDKEIKGYRPIHAGDVVILLRSIRQRTREYAKAFAEVGISLRSESRSGFFKAVEVQEMLAILRVLDNQQQDIPLAAVIRSAVTGFSHSEDALATIACRYKGIPFNQAVTRYAAEQEDEIALGLRTLLAKLARWRQVALQRSTEELISTIYRETSLPAWYAALPNGEQRMANLQYLHQCASKFATFSRQGLYRFLSYLEDLEERDSLAQPPAAMDGHAVRLMTVHASKGLEFPVVIVAGLGNQVNLKDARDALLVHRERGIGLRVADEATNTRYPSIASQVIAAEITRASLAEELRVLYVAMTRAREQLILVGSARSREIDRWSQMAPDPEAALDEYAFLCCRVFLDWLVPLFASSDESTLKLMRVNQLPAVPPKGPAVKDGLGSLLPEGIARPYQPVTEQAIARLEYQYPHRIPVLEPAAVSVTTMAKGGVPKVVTAEDTEQDPQGQEPQGQDPDGDGADLEAPVFVTEAKLASPQEEAATRGTVTHLVMQHFDFARGSESLTEQIDAMVTMKILTQAQAGLVDQPGLVWFLETETGKLMREKAQSVLREVPFLDAIDPPDCPKCSGLDRVMLRGRIDALVPVEGGWMVVDYKTDWRVPEPGDETDRSYRRQVAAYRNALERSGQGKVVRAELIFVRARRIVEIG